MKKITKKQFIEDLTSTDVIFIGGKFSKHELNEYKSPLDELIKEIDIEKEEKCWFSVHSNAIFRHTPSGNISMLAFDQKAKRSFWEYGNIRVMQSTYDNYGKNNYVFYYLCRS